jgi:nucleotide-binding universal stress UspA family protein
MFSRVLVGVDGRDGGRDAIALANQLAATDATIVLAHVFGAGLMPGRGAELLLAAESNESERLLKRERDAAGIEAAVAGWAARSVGRGLHELVVREVADLLVVGSCGRGLLGRVLLGNDTIESLNGAPCAIAIAPSGYAANGHRFSRLGVGFDGSPESEHALAVAREIASRSGATIKALSVVSLQSIPYGEPVPAAWPEFVRRTMAEERRELDGMEGVDGDVSYGQPSEELARYGEELDVLVVGSRSHGRVGRRFNGSTSNYLARRASCPVLVLPRSATSSESAKRRAAEGTEVGIGTRA